MIRDAPRSLGAALALMLAAGAVSVAIAGCGSGGGTSTPSTSTSASVPNRGSTGGSGGRSGGGHGHEAGTAGAPGAPPNPKSSHPHSHHHEGPPGSTMHHTYRGRIVGHSLAVSGPIQPAELWPVRNAWRVSDHRSLTAVYAGANPDDRSTGRLVVFRQDFVHVKQTADDVDVKGSGPVEITEAPEGSGVGSSAQKNGELEFRGQNGVTGTLHLGNDTVAINSG